MNFDENLMSFTQIAKNDYFMNLNKSL
ncbi:hypothetical protein J2Y60_005068, partial [Arcicella sp. BE140]|nr:hypothetical protein [Arcicella sp. BE51]MDR6814844.1 hypothetical protein [Arcicella sp. BE140]MDR6826290.1 hypothetical protein [Arcicella sp. BE139]